MKKLTSTKEKLLVILKKGNKMTIEDIMIHFSVSEIAVRKHLNELVREGFIKKRTVKQKIGRPFYEYELTKKAHQTFPNQYEQLPVELLEDLEQLKGRQLVLDLLEKRMEREKEQVFSSVKEADFVEKIERLVEVQGERGYMMEVEETETGDFIMRNYHCPIANISSNYSQVCHHEMNIYKGLFPKSKVMIHECMSKGHFCCEWMIEKPEKG